MQIKRFIKKWLIQHPNIYHFSWVTYSYITNFSAREHKKVYGINNDDKIFYVIRPRTNGIEGLMSLFLYTLARIDYAQKKGYIPIVDWKNYNTQYYDGKSNVWEWFFSQPCNYTLDEVYSSKNVILSGFCYKKKIDNITESREILWEDNLNKYCSEIINKNITINDSVKEKMNFEKKDIPIDKCLGVYLRGTDYVKLKPVGEWVQPSVSQVIDKVREFRVQYKNIPIFLVTEDNDIYTEIKENFKTELYITSYDSFIKNYDGKDYISKSSVLNHDKIELGTNYLVKLLLLSQCRYLVTSITCGSMAANMFNANNYKDKYVFNLGIYE